MIGLEDLQEGQTVSGRVKRVEGFGVFITLAGNGLTGLCHISEVADEKVANLPSLFQPGQGGHSIQQCHALPSRREGTLFIMQTTPCLCILWLTQGFLYAQAMHDAVMLQSSHFV